MPFFYDRLPIESVSDRYAIQEGMKEPNRGVTYYTNGLSRFFTRIFGYSIQLQDGTTANVRSLSRFISEGYLDISKKSVVEETIRSIKKEEDISQYTLEHLIDKVLDKYSEKEELEVEGTKRRFQEVVNEALRSNDLDQLEGLKPFLEKAVTRPGLKLKENQATKVNNRILRLQYEKTYRAVCQGASQVAANNRTRLNVAVNDLNEKIANFKRQFETTDIVQYDTLKAHAAVLLEECRKIDKFGASVSRCQDQVKRLLGQNGELFELGLKLLFDKDQDPESLLKKAQNLAQISLGNLEHEISHVAKQIDDCESSFVEEEVKLLREKIAELRTKLHKGKTAFPKDRSLLIQTYKDLAKEQHDRQQSRAHKIETNKIDRKFPDEKFADDRARIDYVFAQQGVSDDIFRAAVRLQSRSILDRPEPEEFSKLVKALKERPELLAEELCFICKEAKTEQVESIVQGIKKGFEGHLDVFKQLSNVEKAPEIYYRAIAQVDGGQIEKRLYAVIRQFSFDSHDTDLLKTLFSEIAPNEIVKTFCDLNFTGCDLQALSSVLREIQPLREPLRILSYQPVDGINDDFQKALRTQFDFSLAGEPLTSSTSREMPIMIAGHDAKCVSVDQIRANLAVGISRLRDQGKQNVHPLFVVKSDLKLKTLDELCRLSDENLGVTLVVGPITYKGKSSTLVFEDGRLVGDSAHQPLCILPNGITLAVGTGNEIKSKFELMAGRGDGVDIQISTDKSKSELSTDKQLFGKVLVAEDPCIYTTGGRKDDEERVRDALLQGLFSRLLQPENIGQKRSAFWGRPCIWSDFDIQQELVDSLKYSESDNQYLYRNKQDFETFKEALQQENLSLIANEYRVPFMRFLAQSKGNIRLWNDRTGLRVEYYGERGEPIDFGYDFVDRKFFVVNKTSAECEERKGQIEEACQGIEKAVLQLCRDAVSGNHVNFKASYEGLMREKETLTTLTKYPQETAEGVFADEATMERSGPLLEKIEAVKKYYDALQGYRRDSFGKRISYDNDIGKSIEELKECFKSDDVLNLTSEARARHTLRTLDLLGRGDITTCKVEDGMLSEGTGATVKDIDTVLKQLIGQFQKLEIDEKVKKEIRAGIDRLVGPRPQGWWPFGRREEVSERDFTSLAQLREIFPK